VQPYAVREGRKLVARTEEEDPARQEEELVAQAPRIVDERNDAGLEGLVGGLDSVIISTEHHMFLPAAAEILRYTGHDCREMFSDRYARTCNLSREGSASIILHNRTQGANPFSPFNTAPAAKKLRNTRLETFVFTTPDISRYVKIQRERGIRFVTQEPVQLRDGLFIQTAPSHFTGNSLGFVEWHNDQHSFRPAKGVTDTTLPVKPPMEYLNSIGKLDHAATRVRAQERNAAILEFLSLTNYHYDFAVYVKSLNSITSVARRKAHDFAMVFTSGITPDPGDPAASGPTEAFIRNYGTRVHHIAFETTMIETTVAALAGDGLSYLLDLVGSPEEGLRQIFTVPSPHTMLVTEYIQRYGKFDGFFTKSNVEKLTKATEKQ
jgi:4-hydroxyphenylpyruvate dioxygenase-like putative hemolysin